MSGAKDSQRCARIAFFMSDLEMGGAQRVFLTLSSALAKRGHTVELVLAKKPGPLLAEVDPKVALINLDAHRPGELSWRFGIRTVVKLARHLRQNHPDVLFSTLTGTNLSAIAAHRLAGRRCRLVIREASTLANVQSRMRLRLMRRFYPMADRIIVLTDFMRTQMQQWLRLQPEKITVIGNPADARRIRQLANDPELLALTRQFKPYVVSVARLAHPKDHATAIRALAQIVAKQKLNLVLVGDGPLKGELQALARKLGIEQRVHFVGLQANPYPWMAQAQAYVLSSRWEGYPNVLLEALSLGVPVVVTAYDPSVNAILGDVDNTHVVGVGDESAMASAILRLVDFPERQPFDPPAFEDIITAYEQLAFPPDRRSVAHP